MKRINFIKNIEQDEIRSGFLVTTDRKKIWQKEMEILQIVDSMRTDNNNVDIDIEMANLAKNQLYYSAMAKKMGGYFQRVKNVLQSK